MTHAQELSKSFSNFLIVMRCSASHSPRAYALASETMTGLGDDVENTWRKDGIKGLQSIPGIGESIAKNRRVFSHRKHQGIHTDEKEFPVNIRNSRRSKGSAQNTFSISTIIFTYKRAMISSTHSKRNECARSHIGAKRAKKTRKATCALRELNGSSPSWRNASYLGRDGRGALENQRGTTLRRCGIDPETAGDHRRHRPHCDNVGSGTCHGCICALSRVQRSTNAENAFLRAAQNWNRCGSFGSFHSVFGATLQYFTGDKRHNILLREYALSKGFTLNEYGLFHDISLHQAGRLVVCKTEEEIYQKLGMDTPPPDSASAEMRLTRHKNTVCRS